MLDGVLTRWGTEGGGPAGRGGCGAVRVGGGGERLCSLWSHHGGEREAGRREGSRRLRHGRSGKGDVDNCIEDLWGVGGVTCRGSGWGREAAV